MDGPPRLYSPPVCNGCRLLEVCGASRTAHACPEFWDDPTMPGGGNQSHPHRPGTFEELASLAGPEFDDIVGEPTPSLDLQPYTPQIRYRRSMCGYLHEGA